MVAIGYLELRFVLRFREEGETSLFEAGAEVIVVKLLRRLKSSDNLTPKDNSPILPLKRDRRP